MNQDQKRRDEIMSLERSNYVGGLAKFEELGLEQLETLLKEDFIDLKDVLKSAPTTGDFLSFMRLHPEILAHGFVVGAGRDDYRLRIEGLSFLGKAPDDLKKEFSTFCSQADDLKIEKDELYSWWS